MKIIVDTDVWSEAFRKSSTPKSHYIQELTTLIQDGRVELLGTIKMEILCGIKDLRTFNKINKALAPFPTRKLSSELFTTAAKYFNLCRSKGIQGSNNDFIICAASALWKYPILTKDKDFTHYQKHLPITLTTP